MTNAPPSARLYRNIALIECADEATLAEVSAGPLGRFIVRRLSPTVVVVDHTRADAIIKALQKGGYTPKVTRVTTEERG